MGKIKRERQKFHITSMVDDDTDIPLDTNLELTKYTPLPMAAPMQLDVGENIFAGIDIQLDKVNKFAEPAKSAAPSTAASTNKGISTKSTPIFGSPSTAQPERKLTKKEKMKLRHEKLLQKIDVIQQAKRKHESKKKKKTKTPAEQPPQPTVQSINTPAAVRQPDPSSSKKEFCNLTSIRKELVSLNDSLPSLDSVYRMKSKDSKTGLEQSMKLNSKQRKLKAKSKVDATAIQSSSKAIMKDPKKDAKKEYVKSYDLFRKLLKTAKTTSANPTKLPKQKKYQKK